MLKVENLSSGLVSTNKSQTNPLITCIGTRNRLFDARRRRQDELASCIEQCHQLRRAHKYLFDRQFDSHSNTESTVDVADDNHSKLSKFTESECSSQIKNYAIPRIEYASVVYRQAKPRFESEDAQTLTELEKDLPIVKELAQHLYEPKCANSNDRIKDRPKNNYARLSIKTKQHNPSRLSVSSVTSTDKRKSLVHEKWPDYAHISQIVGYRIEPTPIAPSPSCPSGTTVRGKRNSGLTSASKKVKNAVALGPSPTRREASKDKNSTKATLTPYPTPDMLPSVIIHEPVPIETIILEVPQKDPKPNLPPILCPTSIAYSNRIQTRQWLMKNNFGTNACRTLPLL